MQSLDAFSPTLPIGSKPTEPNEPPSFPVEAARGLPPAGRHSGTLPHTHRAEIREQKSSFLPHSGRQWHRQLVGLAYTCQVTTVPPVGDAKSARRLAALLVPHPPQERIVVDDTRMSWIALSGRQREVAGGRWLAPGSLAFLPAAEPVFLVHRQ